MKNELVLDHIKDHQEWLKGPRDNSLGQLSLLDDEIKGFDFSYKDLSHGEFLKIQFVHCDFTECNMSEMKIKDCRFISCDFKAAEMRNTEIIHSTFDKCDFDHLIGYGLLMDDVILTHSSFRNATLENITTKFTDFTRCDFSLAKITNSIINIFTSEFDSCDFHKTTIIQSTFDNGGFRFCNFTDAVFRYVIFRCVDFVSCSFFSEFYNTKINCSSFRTCLLFRDFKQVEFDSVDLSYSNHIDDVSLYKKDRDYLPMFCPEEGEFYGWKKCKRKYGGKNVIVKLRIPEDAKRSSGNDGTMKCRCDHAFVDSIYELDGTDISDQKPIAVSFYDDNWTYEIGKEIFPDSFDDDRWKTCSNGIHFFMQRKLAELYNY